MVSYSPLSLTYEVDGRTPDVTDTEGTPREGRDGIQMVWGQEVDLMRKRKGPRRTEIGGTFVTGRKGPRRCQHDKQKYD